MIYRALDVNGDYRLGLNRGGFLSGADAVAQAIRTRLLLLRGEWWEDTGDGTPLFGGLLGLPGTTANLQAMDLIVRERILGTEGVASIQSFSSTYENRRYSVSCAVLTDAGATATLEVSF